MTGRAGSAFEDLSGAADLIVEERFEPAYIPVDGAYRRSEVSEAASERVTRWG